MNKDIAIRIKKLTKTYKLYNNHADRVKEVLNPFRKTYHRVFNALSDISFKIQRGETVGIIGRNGSGKSTLLQIISGILQPTTGIVETNGRISALLELGAGFNPEFTGRQNVYINASILGLSKEEIDDRFPEIAAFADIGKFIEQPMKIYSSGMYVRLAFAVAINVNPEILIIDEALAVGDTYFQAKCFDKFREFQEKGITILFVTHALDMITSYCSSAFLLERGAVLSQGDPKQVVDNYNRMLAIDIGENQKENSFNNPVEAENNDFIKKQGDENFRTNPKENRYGIGKAEIVEAGIFSNEGQPEQVLTKREYYEFRMKVCFHEPVSSPIYAYTIRDIKGFDITGNNTYFQKIKTSDALAGDIFVVTFTQRMMLNQGGYLLSFGCTGFVDGEFVVYERRYDYMAFEVVSEIAGVGFIDLAPEVAISKLTR